MNKERKLIIAGNWKMNKTVAEALDLVRGLKIELANVKEVDIVVCPPFTALCEVSKAILETKNIRLGAQNMSEHNMGAYTGEIAAGMLKEFSVRYVILGHSERRSLYGETDAIVNQKVRAAIDAALKPIVCIGETLEQRDAGKVEEVLETQLRGSLAGLSAKELADLVIAYEPVWAIGTGRTPTSPDIAAMHAHIRACLTARLGEGAKAILILYGGSVNPGNSTEILSLPEVGGALVGGASLKAADFLKIITSVKQP